MLVVCRPEAATIAGANESISPDAHVTGRIVKAMYFGSHMEYGIVLEGGSEFTLIDFNPAKSQPLSVGDTAGLRFDEASLHALPEGR